MKKVLFVVGSLGSGGIERQVSDMALYLKQEKEFIPIICCIIKRNGQFLEKVLEAEINVVECSIRKGPLSFIFNMRRLIKSLQPDIVHSHVAFSLLWQTISYKIGGAGKIIFTQQNEYQNWNSFFSRSRLRFYYYFSRIFIDYYTCVSNRVRASLATLLLEKQSAFLVIHNSYDESKFYSRPHERQAIREELGLEPNQFAIIVVGRFAKQKGHIYLIEACKALANDGIEFKVLLIGTGPEMISCKSKIESLGIEDRFVFLGNRSDVNLILCGMDCFVLPSLWEGFGIALVEAMATGLAVIGTTNTAMEEIIEDGHSGILVPPANPLQLKESILKVERNVDLRRKLGAHAQTAATNYSLQFIMKKYLDLYRG